MIRYTLAAALAASLAAAALFWLWQGERDARRAAEAENRGLHEAARVTSAWIEADRARQSRDRLILEEIADAPDTSACADSPSIRAALDGLRRGAGAGP